MTQFQTTIPFHNLTFHDDPLKLRDVEKRLTNFLKTTREKAQRAEIEAGRMTDDDRVYPYDLVNHADKQSIKGRAIWSIERQQAAPGMQHLSSENRVRLTALKGGLPVARVATEHEADEIAAALHAEMPWMSYAGRAARTKNAAATIKAIHCGSTHRL